MKIAIIGAGNMGGAVARGLAKGGLVQTSDIYDKEIENSSNHNSHNYRAVFCFSPPRPICGLF